MADYYTFRQEASRVEENLMLKIGQHSTSHLREAWAILFRYSIMRFGGITQSDIIAAGNFLNYGITWDAAERVYVTLSQEPWVASSLPELFQVHKKLCDGIGTLAETLSMSDY
jgi:hypothetical protein